MILPKINYCDILSNVSPPSMLYRLERLQRTAKIILKEYDLSNQQLLQQLRWKTITSRRIIHRLTFVFKRLNVEGLELFQNL